MHFSIHDLFHISTINVCTRYHHHLISILGPIFWGRNSPSLTASLHLMQWSHLPAALPGTASTPSKSHPDSLLEIMKLLLYHMS